MIQEETQFPNSLLEKYNVLQKISNGGYAEVYQGKCIKTNIPVAIKVMKNIFCDCIDAKRILREICILKQLNHPNIVKILDLYIGPIDYQYADFQNVYLILEYYPIDLKQFISNYQFEDQSPTTNELIKHIMRQLVDALTYLQSRHVMHRDLKPANIIVNEQLNVKICDFGLSRVLTLSAKQQENQILNQLQQLGIKNNDINFLELKQFVSNENKKKTKKKNSTRSNQENCNHLTMDKILSQPLIMTNNNYFQDKDENSDQESNDIIYQYTQLSQQKNKQKELLIELFYQTDVITQHIGTRWYRAPEIILLNQTHDYKVDSWSLGCIFAELLGTLSHDSLKGALFPGSSCYPLSPKKIKQETFYYNYDSFVQTSQQIAVFDQKEQLFIILNVLGSKNSSEANTDFIQNPSAKEFIQQFTDINGMKFEKLYPNSTEEELDFLKQLLTFSPNERAQICDLQEHKYLKIFNEKKKQSLDARQKPGDQQNIMQMQIDPVVLDFDIKFTDQYEGFFLDEIDLRLLFLRELNQYQPIFNYQLQYGQYCDILVKKIQENKKNRTTTFEI